MNLAKSLLFVSIGIILTSLLIKFTEVQTNYLLIAGVVLACLSLLLPLLSSSSTASMKSTKAAKSDTVDGKVKWFNRTKGFGFITQSNGDDVFVHQTSIKSQPRFLREGQSVTMNVVEDEKGPQAENVKVA